MDIQWVIIAQSHNLNEDGTVDIGRISHHANILGKLKNTFPLVVLAKPHFTPTEVGESKTITLEVVHDKYGLILSEDSQYKVPDLYTWANRITYIALEIKAVTFPYSGGYTFKILVDGVYKNSENLEVTDLLEAHNEKS